VAPGQRERLFQPPAERGGDELAMLVLARGDGELA
jgi:hypothetical protein